MEGSHQKHLSLTMFGIKSLVFTSLALLAAQVSAVPSPQSSTTVPRCMLILSCIPKTILTFIFLFIRRKWSRKSLALLPEHSSVYKITVIHNRIPVSLT
ncbi:hypothetical protein BDZ97DRAFT_1168564 [Flammula alnicola]|nr:hypothetical protein BDZ97DRAFT_1168564 [Flammula alnicola]